MKCEMKNIKANFIYAHPREMLKLHIVLVECKYFDGFCCRRKE